jgi:hypothetical protein
MRHVKFEFLMAVKMVAFRVVTQCGLVGGYGSLPGCEAMWTCRWVW